MCCDYYIFISRQQTGLIARRKRASSHNLPSIPELTHQKLTIKLKGLVFLPASVRFELQSPSISSLSVFPSTFLLADLKPLLISPASSSNPPALPDYGHQTLIQGKLHPFYLQESFAVPPNIWIIPTAELPSYLLVNHPEAGHSTLVARQSMAKPPSSSVETGEFADYIQ